MLMHVPIHVAFCPVRKEQVFGGSFLHLLLISIVFSSFTIEFNGLPVDFIVCKNIKDLQDFANPESKQAIFLNRQWNAIGEGLHTQMKVVLWLFLLLQGKKTQNLGDESVSLFIYHALKTQKIEILSCICLDVKKLLFYAIFLINSKHWNLERINVIFSHSHVFCVKFNRL